MVQATAIEWTDRTGNPIRARHKVTKKVGWGCVDISPGCAHCFSGVFNKRFGTKLPYTRRSLEMLEFFLDERVLRALLKLRKPQRIFICDMTDLFGDWVDEDILDRIFCTMAMCRHLTFQVLTKRPERMRDYLRQVAGERDMQRWAQWAYELTDNPSAPALFEELDWPLPNVWLGVSVEDQKRADERIPVLLETPAAVRFLSVEPLIGPVDLRKALCACPWPEDALRTRHLLDCPADMRPDRVWPIDWIIVGGESGHGARPMHPLWASSIRDQCQAAGVPFFFKQWGELEPMTDAEGYGYALTSEMSDAEIRSMTKGVKVVEPEGRVVTPEPTREWWDRYQAECWSRYHEPEDPQNDLAVPYAMHRVGKGTAGRLLDGRTWDEFPEVARG